MSWASREGQRGQSLSPAVGCTGAWGHQAPVSQRCPTKGSRHTQV